MFKFLHAADVHLDSPLRGLARYDAAPADIIRKASRRAFENLVDLAIEEGVSFVLLAGDLYDGDWKDFNTGIFMSKQLGRLSAQGIRVFSVAGNHDAASKMTRALKLPVNMVAFPTRAPHTERIAELGVAIHGQGFGAAITDENLAAGFPNATPGLLNIGLLHTSLDGREGHDRYAPCTVDDLRSKGYDYWALGHVHQTEFVSDDPWIVFPGCIQGRHIKETGPKGCVLVTVAEDAVQSVERRRLDVLRWELCRVDLFGAEDDQTVMNRVESAMIGALAAADGIPMAMRLRFEGVSSMADALAAFPERLEGQLGALAAGLAGDLLWIEKVELALSPKRGLSSDASSDQGLCALIDETMAIGDDIDSIAGLKEVVAELQRKLPLAARSGAGGLNIESDEVLARIVREAKQLLLGRLLDAGGGE